MFVVSGKNMVKNNSLVSMVLLSSTHLGEWWGRGGGGVGTGN